MRSKTSLDSSREVAQGCGVSFVNCLYLVPLIISQNFCAACTKPNQTWPMHRIIHAPAAGGQNYKSKRTSYSTGHCAMHHCRTQANAKQMDGTVQTQTGSLFPVCLIPTKFPNFPNFLSHPLSHRNIKYSK